MRTLLAIALLSVSVCACHRPGPMERTGERVDEIADNVREGENPLKRRGPLERAGETVDDALGGD